MAIRISTQTMYDRNVQQLSNLQGNMLRTQMQLSTERRVLTPADDPVELRRAGEAIEQGNAVKQDAAGERPEHEIFEPRFGRALVGAAIGSENVGR